jgi:aminoglycoside N3'-acetyltransferase
MTTVEWLEEQYIKHSGNLLEMGKAFEQAKEMEKQQIEDANIYGWRQALDESVYSLDTEQYYNETFKSE